MGTPQGAPMGMPGPKEGLRAKSIVDIQNAVKLLTDNLKPDVFPVEGAEWKAIHGAIKSLSKITGGEQSKELGMQGIKSVMAAMSPKGMGALGGGAPQGGGMPMGGPGPMALGGM